MIERYRFRGREGTNLGEGGKGWRAKKDQGKPKPNEKPKGCKREKKGHGEAGKGKPRTQTVCNRHPDGRGEETQEN